MARRCVTDNTPGLCCAAVQQFGQAVAAQGFQHADARTGKMRCHTCKVKPRSKNRGQGFEHRFAKSSVCGIISGCPALQPGGGGQSLTIGGGAGAPVI
jgi:hypothetical protein